MSSIDERIVHLKFDNKQFEQGVRQSQATLQNLNKNLQMKGAAKGLQDVSNTAKRFSLANIASQVQQVSSRFTALGVVGTAALGTITAQATMAGANLIKSLTIAPIMDGFREYETNMNSIQTILANTAHQGTNLKQVNAALEELNTYSDKTIYNFSEMAKNIGTFTAAGVNLDTSTAAIKGIANLAAVSGSNSQQASTAMYQLSQALAAGKVSLMDWNSVVNAGMGGKVFQDALMETARVHGVAIDDMVKSEGGFRNTLQKGWLTSDILTETLNKFTGDLNAKQLKTMGYNDEQIKKILQMGKTAQDAATKIKTFSQLIGSLQEAVGSGWAKTWQLLFGDFEEAKTLFTNIGNTLGEIVGKSAESRNNLIKGWKDLGGRQAIVDGLGNTFNALMAALKPIGQAFRDIFPAVTAKQLADMSKSFRDFTAGLKMGAATSEKVRSVFRGLFAILDIGRMALVGAVKMFLNLFGVVSKGSGSLLDGAASLGDFLTNLRNTLKSSGAIDKFFSNFANGFGVLTDGLGKFFSQFAGFEGFIGGFMKVFSVLGEAVKSGLSKFFAAFSNIDGDAIFAGLNSLLLGGGVLLIKKFVDTITGLFDGVSEGGGLLDGFKEMMGAVTETFGELQNNLKANTILQIAAAIALIAGSLSVLSKIDAGDLTKSMTAITGVLAQLGGALFALSWLATGKLALQLPLIATGLVIFAGAVRVMAGAIKTLSGMSWDELLRGLAGLAGTMGLMVGALKLMKGLGKGLVPAAAGLVIMGGAIKLLAESVKSLSGLSWDEMGKGLVGVGTLLGALALFTKFASVSKGGLAYGAGLILLGTAIRILASAVTAFGQLDTGALVQGLIGLTAVLTALAAFSALSAGGVTLVATGAALVLVAGAINMLVAPITALGSLDLGTLAKGLLGMAAALAIIGAALVLIPPTSLGTAAALVAVSLALQLITTAVVKMGEMSWEAIAKSMVAMAGALTILGLALYGMTAALPGAAALIVAAGAMALMVPPLVALGMMSWENIAKGLVALAGGLTVIGVAGVLITAAVPGLLGLGAAAVLLGGAALAAGAGVKLFASGLATLAGLGGAAVKSIGDAFKGLLKLVPAVAKGIADGFTEFMRVIAANSPKIAASFTKIIVSFLDSARKFVNQYGEAATRLIVAFLNSIARNMPRIAAAGTNLILAFMAAIQKNFPKIIAAGIALVIALVNGVANGIRNNKAAMTAAGYNLGSAIIEGMTAGLAGGIAGVTSAAMGVAKTALAAAKNALGIHSPSREFMKLGQYSADGFAIGLRSGGKTVQDAVSEMFDLTGSVREAASERVAEFQKEATAYRTTLKNLNANSAASKQKISSAIASNKTQMAALNKATAARNRLEAQNAALAKKNASLKTNTKNAKVNAANRKTIAANKKAMTANNKAIGAQYKAQKTAYSAVQKNNKAIVDQNKAMENNRRQALVTQTAIRDAERARNEAAAEAKRAADAEHYIRITMAGERNRLMELERSYDTYTDKVNEASKALEDAIRTREDYAKSLNTKMTDLPEMGKDSSYSTFVEGMQKKIADTVTMAGKLQQLKAMGLNKDVLKEFLDTGPEALPFIQTVLDQGQAGINELNALAGRLSSEAMGFSQTASYALYQSGVDAAQGLLNGLKSQQAAISAQMDVIATAMVNAINKKLGIHSPSREFAKIGVWITKGLTQGLVSGENAVADSASNMGQNALNAMRASMAALDGYIPDAIELRPVITPVLDLSSIQSGAKSIDSYIGGSAISVRGTYDSAVAADRSYEATRAIDAGGVNESVQFVQNNYSPKALSPTEIYRQTNNQLSRMRGALSNAK